MSVAKVYSAHVIGITAAIVSVEVDISNGLHSFSVVGLGDKAVGESKDRMAAAIKNSGFVSPKQKNQKVVISLAPADIRKEGPIFDLAMALGYLLATGEIHFNEKNKIFIGELSLEGNLRRVTGILSMVQAAKAAGFKEIFVPRANAKEAGLISGVTVYPVSSLLEILSHLEDKIRIVPQEYTLVEKYYSQNGFMPDMQMVVGQENAKRALEIAAAGKHTVAMIGPPGVGKSMLAKSFPSILPPLSYEEIIEITKIHSIAKTIGDEIITSPPFRTPHHTSSLISLVGGGNKLQPGEITLAHHGVLFLDEFTEFNRHVIDALRQPLEDRKIVLARAKGSIVFPAECICIIAMNPCPCGYASSEKDATNTRAIKKCLCTNHQLETYRRKISGPIIDRIDLWVSLTKVDYEKMVYGISENNVKNNAESSSNIRKRVTAARVFQEKNINIEMTKEAQQLLVLYSKRFTISGRAFEKSIRIAKTIASLAQSTSIQREHILEALQYRKKDML